MGRTKFYFLIFKLLFVLTLVYTADEVDEIEFTNEDICVTPECFNTEIRVSKFMDSNVEPCDDFFKFACGNITDNPQFPRDEVYFDAVSLIKSDLFKQLRTIMEENVQPDEEKHFKMMKLFYKNCMNQTEINKKGLQSAKDILKKLGGWPVLDGDAWQDGDFEWKQSVKKFKDQGFSMNYFFGISISVDVKNIPKQVLNMDQMDLIISRDYLIKDLINDHVKAYYDYMVDIAVIFGAPRDTAEKEFRESLEFEMKLANISVPSENGRNSTALYNPMTVRELQGNYSSIPWKEYFNAILEPIAQIKDDEVVIVNVPSFFRDFEKIMEHTPKRVQANYVMWRAVESIIDFLNDEVLTRKLKFITGLTGQTEGEPRWKTCTHKTNEYLGLSVGALYVSRYFNEDNRKSTIQMVASIREVFEKLLQTVGSIQKKFIRLRIFRKQNLKHD